MRTCTRHSNTATARSPKGLPVFQTPLISHPPRATDPAHKPTTRPPHLSPSPLQPSSPCGRKRGIQGDELVQLRLSTPARPTWRAPPPAPGLPTGLMPTESRQPITKSEVGPPRSTADVGTVGGEKAASPANRVNRARRSRPRPSASPSLGHKWRKASGDAPLTSRPTHPPPIPQSAQRLQAARLSLPRPTPPSTTTPTLVETVASVEQRPKTLQTPTAT